MTSAPAIAIAKASATPPGSSKNASTAKNAAKLKSPNRRPRITAIAAATPCRRWANTHRTAAYTGNGESRPESRDPRAGAAEVSAHAFASAAQQRTGLDSRVFQRLPHGRCDRARVRSVAVNADRIDRSRLRERHRLPGGFVRRQHRVGPRSWCEPAVGQQHPVGEAFAIDRDPRALSRRHHRKAGLAHEPDAVLRGHTGDGVGSVRIALAPVIQRAVRFQVGDRRHRREPRHLERDQRLELLRSQAALDPAELHPVLVTRVRTDLDAELAAAPRGGDGDGHRPGVRAAGDVGAVDEAEDRLLVDAALAQVGVEVHSCLVSPRKSASACSRTGITADRDSTAPFGLPGTLITSVWPRTPARPLVSAAIGVTSNWFAYRMPTSAGPLLSSRLPCDAPSLMVITWARLTLWGIASRCLICRPTSRAAAPTRGRRCARRPSSYR